ncbi:MAG: TonB family protein [Planctomycetes bacterium]|nr:TonB family protein [Planctomycetota bacterium]
MMNPLLSKLLSLRATETSVACGVSIAVHAACAVAAWLTVLAVVGGPERPGMPGTSASPVELHAQWSQPEPEPEPLPVIMPPLETHVLIKPETAQVGRRTFVPTSTDISRPTPSDEDAVRRMLRLPSPSRVTRDSVTSGTTDSGLDAPSPRTARRRMTDPQPIAISSDGAIVAPRRTPARLRDGRPPAYPPWAESQRLEGTVHLRIYLDSTGRVGRVEVVSSSGHPILDASAVRAVGSWRFEPATTDGRPVGSILRLPVRFALD